MDTTSTWIVRQELAKLVLVEFLKSQVLQCSLAIQSEIMARSSHLSENSLKPQ